MTDKDVKPRVIPDNIQLASEDPGDNLHNFSTKEIKDLNLYINIALGKERNTLNQVRSVADIGRGLGVSSLAVLELCPNLELLQTTDNIQKIDKNVEDLLNKFSNLTTEHFDLDAKDFLQQVSPESLDIITTYNIPSSILVSEDEYQLLFQALHPGGLVVITSGTSESWVNQEFMSKYFEKISPEGFELAQIWKRK